MKLAPVPILLSLSMMAATPWCASAQTPIRPDLVPLSSYMSGWTVQNLGGNNREIRLSTSTGNGGQGAFHMYGTGTIITNPDGTQSQNIMQRVFNSDATFTDRLMGAFTYHPTHSHIHVDRWNAYQLRIRTGANVGPIVAQSFYTSFCIFDLNHYNPVLPGSPAGSVYNSCVGAQGLSVGWNDVQGSSLSGQSINITGVPNGDYWLEHEADPMNVIEESNETNNVARIPITLSGQPTPALMVNASSPSGTVAAPVNGVDIYFNQLINAATFTLADVVFNGPSGAIVISSITPISDTSGYRVNFANQMTAGTYTMTVGPNIANGSGQLMNQNYNGVAGEAADAFTKVFSLVSVCDGPADLNCDGSVGVPDLLMVINAWGPCDAPCPPHCAEDLNMDCSVGTPDLLLVINNWG